MIFYLDLEVVERDLDLRRDRRDLDLEEELLDDDVDLDLFDNSFEIKKGNVFSLLPKLNSEFDIIFADPPYETNYFHKLTELIDSPEITADSALFIYEHFKKDQTPDYFGNFKKLRDKTYGDSRISIYKKGEVTKND